MTGWVFDRVPPLVVALVLCGCIGERSGELVTTGKVTSLREVPAGASVNLKYLVVMETESARFAVDDRALWSRLKEGQTLVITYRTWTKDGKVYEYEFVSAEPTAEKESK